MSDWQRVQDIFLASADLPAADRRRVLEELCGEEGELRREVESLLAADSDSAVTIDSAIQGIASTILDSPVLIGERLGAYRIVREIGRGGMGSVYLALRDDEEYIKEVALKVVKRGMNTAEVLRRFRDERQILANLDHPYIARLFDGGSTADGVPFFAMEYVEGQPVDVFCRENSLDVKARCELFLHILEAVAYAHRNLVVHGDLKPANIFVTADGTPKLLDFGVAKLVGKEQAIEDEISVAAARVYTPGYASPEQVRGTAVTTSTDIYSLGAVFYELLSGRRAQPINFDTPTRIEYAVCEEEVLRPGLVARDLPADLDDVVLMALCKEPELRYESAIQFAEDIKRCLERRPVLAHPNTVGYRARKFVVRNRLQVAMGAMVAAALVGGLAVSLVQTHRARAERAAADSQRQIALRERSEAEAARASEAQQRTVAVEERRVADEQRGLAENERDEAKSQRALADQRSKDIIDLAGRTLFDVNDAIAPLAGSLPARRKIAETTLEYLKNLESTAGTNSDMREALTEAYYKVSLIQGDPHGPSLQDSASAEKSLLKAEEILMPAYNRKPNDPGLMLRLLEVRSGLAELMNRSGRTQGAVKIYLKLLPVAHRLSHLPGCDTLLCEMQESVIESALAYQLSSIDPAQALVHANHAVEICRELVARHPEDKGLKQGLGAMIGVAASAHKSLGELEKAADNYRESIELREELVRNDPGNLIYRRNLLVACGNYATLLGVPWSQNLGRSDEARVVAAKGVAIARDMAGADAKDATARFDLGMSLGRLGMIDPAPGEAAISLAQLREAESLIAPIAAANPKSADAAIHVAEVLEYEAYRQEELGRVSEAIQTFHKSLALLEPFMDMPKNPVGAGYIADEEGLALAFAMTRDRDSALLSANKALEAAEKNAAQTPSSDLRMGTLARAWATLALTQSKTGSPELARGSAEKAMQIWGAIHTPGTLTAFRKPISETKALLEIDSR